MTYARSSGRGARSAGPSAAVNRSRTAGSSRTSRAAPFTSGTRPLTASVVTTQTGAASPSMYARRSSGWSRSSGR